MIVKENGGNFRPAPSGLHPAVCADIVDLGIVKSHYGEQRKVRLVFQIDEIDKESGKRFLVSNMYTPSLNEKANLRKQLEAWRSRPFTTDELKNGFDLERLIGINCQLQVIHNERDGRTYANVAAIVPAARGAAPLLVVGYTRMKDRKSEEEEGSFQATDEDVPF